jgi:thiol:disulfide interchange protein
LKKMPKAGGWLNETKVVMGFVELSAAVKFLNGADLALGWYFFTRNVCLALWIAIFGLTGLYLIGIFRMPKDMPRQKTSVVALMFAILFLTTSIYLTTGLNGRPLGTFVEGWLPPIERHFQNVGAVMSGHGGAEERTGWDGRFEDDYEGARAEAKRKGLPLFVDFTGYTCANCRAVEAAIFMNSPEVRKQLKGFVVAELHLDGANDVRILNQALANRLAQTVAMPTYVIVDPKTEKVINKWGWENADPARWQSKVKDALERWKTLNP